MGHIHLHVSELKKTEEFYVKGLGFDVVNRVWWAGVISFLREIPSSYWCQCMEWDRSIQPPEK